MSSSPQKGQPREAENQSRTTTNRLLSITMTKNTETVLYETVSMTSPCVQLLYQHSLNCLISISSCINVALLKTITRNTFRLPVYKYFRCTHKTEAP